MAAVQVRQDNDVTPFIRYGMGTTKNDAVILQDAGRTEPLLYGTLMAKIAATGKWVPFTDETATDGSAIPQGFFVGSEVPAAALVAGDVTDVPILIGIDCIVSRSKIVMENSKTLDTVITVGTTDLRTVEDRLADRGLFIEDSVDISSFENI